LYSALLRLRTIVTNDASQDAAGASLVNLFVWIDALCINQSSLAERSQQIPIMSQIYTRAAYVWVWLGEDSSPPRAHLAVSILGRAAEYARQEVDSNVPDGDKEQRTVPKSTELIQEAPNSALKLQRNLPPEDHEDWEALWWLLDKPWFRRIWILQEAAVADVRIMVGQEMVPWPDVVAGARWLSAKRYWLKWQESEKLAQVGFIWALGPLSQPSKEGSIVWLLEQTRHFGATDKRDKVYALLGLCGENAEAERMKPDYSKSVVEVYSAVVRHLILEGVPLIHGPLAVLSMSGLDEGDSELEEGDNSDAFPSWVPRWDLLPSHPNGSFILSAVRMKWQASKSMPATMEIITKEIIRDTDGNWITNHFPPCLNLKGIKVSTVVHIDTSIVNFSPHDQAPVLLQLFVSTIDKLDGYAGEEEAKDAFAATITAGQSRNGPDDSEPWSNADLEKYFFQDTIFGGQVGLDHAQHPCHTEFAKHVRRLNPLIITSHGHVGRGPPATKVGDVVCVLFGGRVPYIIRPRGDHYQFVGECYVYGLMNGEVIDAWQDGYLIDESIELR
jgi:Heterokaryon incompatibility protein (HET)